MKIKSITTILLALVITVACNLLVPGGVNAPPSTLPGTPASSGTGASTPSWIPATNIPMVPAVSQAICQDEDCMANGLTLSYLIVTRPLFVDALTPFINWKSGQGYRVGLVTVDWMSQRFPARHLAESMKTGMHTLRRNTGVQYVLLIGDTEITRKDWDVNAVLASYTLTRSWNVPTGFFRQLNIDPPSYVAPSDAYFVEDRDWDPQNTGLNPIVDLDTGLGQLDATLFLGRWPVRSPGEIAPIFAKTQRLTPTNKIFFTFRDEMPTTSLEEYLSQCLELPFPNWSCYQPDHARLRLFEQNAPWLTSDVYAVTADDTQQGEENYRRLSTFDGVIIEDYHGDYDYLAMPKSEVLSSHDYRMLMVGSCRIWAFYSGTPDTFGESLLKSPSGPAILVYPPNDYVFLMYLREGQSVGQAFWRSAAIVWGGGSNPLLGDPSLQVMVQPPGN